MNPALSFHRGSLALDFVGTVGKRASRSEERLPDARAFDAWLRAAGLAERGVHATPAELDQARALREAIARTCSVLIDGERPARADVATINAFAAASTLARPAFDGKTMRMRWLSDEPVRGALGRIAADAVDLLATRCDRLVRCELPGCGGILLSHSRGPARRWCTMETCGNIAKVAAHRSRARSKAGAGRPAA